jgi:hypothetical protein
MFVKYVGPAHTRTIARYELGVHTEADDRLAFDEEGNPISLVWDPLVAMTQEMTKDEYDTLGRLTFRGDWEVLEEAPDLPPVSVNVAPDQAFMPESGLEADGTPPDDETIEDD